MAEAKKKGADVSHFPESSLSGYTDPSEPWRDRAYKGILLAGSDIITAKILDLTFSNIYNLSK